MTAAFAGRSVWIFDVDYTLYAPEAALFEQVASRITAFVSSALELPLDQARAKQREYYLTYGTTLAGMVRHHGIDPRLFIGFVHDIDYIDYGVLTPNRSLKHKIAALPGRKLIFTNATLAHVDKVLGGLDLSFNDFDGAFDAEMADWTPKPNPLPYERLMERFQVAPHEAVFFEDTAQNLETAKALGWSTVWVKSDQDAQQEGLTYSADLTGPRLEGLLDQILKSV